MKKVFMIGMSHEIGGVETYILNLARCIGGNGIQLYYPQNGVVAGEDILTSLGAIPIPVPANRHHILSYKKAYDRIFREYCFDAVYYNTCDILSLDPLIFAKQHGVPVRIIHSHNSNNSVRMDLYHRLLEKHCRRNLPRLATHYLACSKTAGDWMFDGRSYQLIRNGITTEDYRFQKLIRDAARKGLGLSDERAYCFIGRLMPQKNPLFLCSIMREIVKKEPHSRLFVIGDGELRSEMERKVCDMGISDCVQFLGVRQDIPQLLSAMDCLLLPSLWEGLPFVLVEAQANGLPCVVSANVSEQSNLTDEMCFIPLDAPVARWADSAITAAARHPRDQYADIVRAVGFDMQDAARDVMKILDT